MTPILTKELNSWGLDPASVALSPILADTMLGLAPTAALAATETPYHPTVLWATTKWKNGMDEYPHASPSRTPPPARRCAASA